VSQFNDLPLGFGAGKFGQAAERDR